jgi:hypothetical protein
VQGQRAHGIACQIMPGFSYQSTPANHWHLESDSKLILIARAVG